MAGNMEFRKCITVCARVRRQTGLLGPKGYLEMNKTLVCEDAIAHSISALPDYAQIFSFLEYFGHLLLVPTITLDELEHFFDGGKLLRCISNACK